MNQQLVINLKKKQRRSSDKAKKEDDFLCLVQVTNEYCKIVKLYYNK